MTSVPLSRRGRRRAVPVALGLAVVAVAGVAAATLLGRGDDAGARKRSATGASATVTRRTLVERETVDGTLGYAGHRTVINRLAASSSGGADSPEGNRPASYHGSGTLTSMARSGSVVSRGGALYRLDGEPIVLMYGSTPAYRALRAGVSDGPDVLELERNLAALGFDPGSVDDSFTSTTATALRDWQESVGLERSGSVELGRVVFMPGPRRIGGHTAAVGSILGSGAEVLDTSSTKRVVSVPLDATKQSLAREGGRVTVTLPDGRVLRGRIAKIGRVAREADSGSDDPNAEKQLVIDVTVELRSKRGIGRLDEAPVGVGLAAQSRKHVLSVPVNALLARRGGGYGVELAGSHRVVAVEAGLFADGYVEVSGRAIRTGTRVVVPRD